MQGLTHGARHAIPRHPLLGGIPGHGPDNEKDQRACQKALHRRTAGYGVLASMPRRCIPFIVTAKLNGVDPRVWLADVLARVTDHPASRLDELLPWN